MDSRVAAAAAFVVLSGCYMRIINAHQARKAKRKRRWWMTSLNRSRDRYCISLSVGVGITGARGGWWPEEVAECCGKELIVSKVAILGVVYNVSSDDDEEKDAGEAGPGNVD
ncbi:hypothetical protein FQA39_LY05607 [Lamprigera yunnana]|nr:hypothetical protein FQA39_LY05607 [Lamprigera yunnana]